jgi:hypothetical protein
MEVLRHHAEQRPLLFSTATSWAEARGRSTGASTCPHSSTSSSTCSAVTRRHGTTSRILAHFVARVHPNSLGPLLHLPLVSAVSWRTLRGPPRWSCAGTPRAH